MNSVAIEKTMTIREVAEALGYDESRIRQIIKELFPDKMQAGKAAHLNEAEVTLIKMTLQNSGKNSGVTTDLEMLILSKKVDAWKDQKISSLVAENETMKPKAIAFDAFLSADNAQPVGEVARLLGFGRTTFFAMMRKEGILMKNNTPYQEYMKYFKVIDHPVPMGERAVNKPVTLVLPEGIDFLAKRFNVKEAS